MKRRLVFFGMLMCTLLGMFGCSKDLYKDMRLSLMNNESEVQLFVEQTYSNGNYEYTYDTYNLDVQVSGVGDDVSKDIQLSGGEEFVKYTFSSLGIGKHRVAITPISYDKTGKFTLVIKTMEGNKSLSLDLKIDLKIAGFDFKTDSLTAVTKGGQIDLTDVDKYISFTPKETSQKDIEFEVVTPTGGFIEGRPEYTYKEEEYPQKYAEVKNGILKTYSGKNVVYPKLYTSSTIEDDGTKIAMQVVTLRAKYVGKLDENGLSSLPYKYIDIFVVDNCDNVELRMEAQKNGQDLGSGTNSFALTKNADGEYDVTLINPQFGVNNKNYDEYFIKRNLIFDFSAGLDQMDENYNPDNYKVLLSADDNAPNITNDVITLSSGLDNSFVVEAIGAGKYTHRFKIDHKDERFRGIIDTEIVVNFNVISLPTQITINNSQVIKQNDTENRNVYTIYNTYGKSAYGTKFEIKLNNAQDFKYFVYFKDENGNGDLVDHLQMFGANNYQKTFGRCVNEEGTNYSAIVSSSENVPYSLFSNNEAFYLKHDYAVLPEETKQIYIGVMYNVASSSYSDADKANYFVDAFVEFPINLNFERGIDNIQFKESKYWLDVTDSNLISQDEDGLGLELFSLPQGQKPEKVIDTNGLTYDNQLIRVYSYLNEAEDIYTFYLKVNTTYKTGNTTLFVRTKNGITTSVNITAFIPTIYAENQNILDENEQMPLGLSFDVDDALFYFTGKNENSPYDKYTLYKTFEGVQDDCGKYVSLQKLFMLINTSIDIKFYDYLVTKNGLTYDITPIDVTNNVKIAFNDLNHNYAKFENGRLTIFKNTTDFKDNPITMTVTYTGGHITEEEGVQKYSTYTTELVIELYIYKPLQGADITTPKNVDIYVKDSIGYVSSDGSKNTAYYEQTIKSEFRPNEIALGGQWNEDWFNPTSIPVNMYYDIEQTLSSPVRINGVELILYTRDGRPYQITNRDGTTRGLVYGDLFSTTYRKIPPVGEDPQYNCTVTCEMSDEFKTWFRTQSGYNDSDYDWYLINRVFNNNITMSVNVYITQFSKLQNINNVKFNAKYATKASDFSVDVATDGVYFEIRSNEDLVNSSINVAYSLNTTNAINKGITLVNANNSVFRAVVANGVIKITPQREGVEYLTVTPSDNIKGKLSEDEYTYYNNSLVQTFRVMVANGSAMYPFEIKSVSNYEKMLEDIEKASEYKRYYNYVITNNINLSKVNKIVDIKDIQNLEQNFSLTGEFSYYRNNIKYENIYSLSGLNIRYNASNLQQDINLGLFGSICNAAITNLDLINSNIVVTIGKTNGHALNVGMLSGLVSNSTISGVSVQGSITIENASSSGDSGVLNVGGMFGLINNDSNTTKIVGLPAKYLSGYSSSSSNSNVKINYSICRGSDVSSYAFNVGGMVGNVQGNVSLSSLVVTSTIVGSNYESNVGSVVGLAQNGKIENVTVYPSINILNNESIKNSGTINVSTFVASIVGTNNVNIKNSKVYYTKDKITDWQQALGVIVNTPNNIVNFGSYAGSVASKYFEIAYSYVRSFYNKDSANYHGDIYIKSSDDGKIGGLIGAVGSSQIEICYSYFQAGLIVCVGDDLSDPKVSTGLLVADNAFGSGSKIINSYAIGSIKVSRPAGISDLDQFAYGMIYTNTFADIDSNDVDAFGVQVNADKLQKSNTIANLEITNVYGIVNSNTYFFGKNNILLVVQDSKPLVGSNLSDRILPIDNTYDLFVLLGYNIINDVKDADGNNPTANRDNVWVINKNINTFNETAFPVLLTENSAQGSRRAMFDLVPTKINFGSIKNVSGLYDISANGKVQLMMFLNKKSGTTLNNCFTIGINQNSQIVIEFEGASIETNFFVISSELEFIEDKNGSVISIVANRVYPVGSGVATLTVRSVLDKTVTLDIVIKVINGITDLQLTPVQNVNYDEDGTTPVVYIDEVSYFEITNINNINNIDYDSSKEYGYKLEVLESVGQISINGTIYSYKDGEDNTSIISQPNLTIKGVKNGKIDIKVTPIVYISELENNGNEFVVLESISKTLTFVVNSRARDLSVSKADLTIAPKNTTNFVLSIETSNLTIDKDNNKIIFLSPIDVVVNGQKYVLDITNREFEFVENSNVYTLKNFNYEINFELIKISFTSCKVVANLDTLNSEYTFNVLIDAQVSFNSNYYRTHADDFDLNTISYRYNFAPRSNPSVSDSIVIYISPNMLTSIFTNYYSRGELLSDESEKYANENSSDIVVPGEKGLLKITLDEEFNDSSYITVTLANAYQDYVTLIQMAGQVNGYVLDTATNDLTDYIDSYREVIYSQTIQTEQNYGIRLSKLTLNYNEQNYFNKTYFVKLALNRSYGDLEQVELVITSYKVDRNSQNPVTQNKTKNVVLSVAQLPLIDVKVDDSHSAYLGKGVKKELQVTHRGITNDVSFSINKKNTNNQLIDASNSGITIQDENGVIVNGLNIDYLNQNKKYYLCADLTSDIASYVLNFKAEEIIFGVMETNLSDLAIQTVEFEIDDIKLEGMVDGVVTIKHGQNFAINTAITYKKPTVGDNISEFEQSLRLNNFGPVSLAEYAGAGQTVTRATYSNNVLSLNETLVRGQLRLGYLTYQNGDRVFSPVDMLHNDYNYVRLYENQLETVITKDSTEYSRYTNNYYSLKGVGITGDYELTMKLTIPYYYDQDGKLVVDSDTLRYLTKEIVFKVVVEDSSTYDHPNPIETQEDLLKACTSGTGDYILLNNITLTNWVPQDVNFKSLDGNGYIIKLNSFNLNSKRGQDNADVGIFATVSENTLLKNITVDVSQMLITEDQMLNQVSTLLNSTSSDTYDSTKANFDMSYTSGVNFGILAGTNNGSITNAKIVSTNNVDTVEPTTKMYLHIVTSQGYINNNLVNSNIAGLVGVNSSTGAITNSLVGLSLPNMSGSTSQLLAVKNPSTLTYNNNDDSLENITIYPFIIAGGNKLAGVVSENNGIVSNTYVKGLGLYNTYPAVTDSQTGGLVATNNSIITSSFVEGKSIENYRGESTSKFIIESTGNVGGLVFNNNGTIENSYSNVYLETQSAFTGGFVFSNNSSGVIVNSYSTAVNKNSLAHGQFTGIAKDGNSILNEGSYNNCYYMVLDGENVNQLEVATAIVSRSSKIDDRNSWRGFSFASNSNAEGIWVISQGYAPRLASSLNDTTSFRKLTEIVDSTQDDIVITVYNYEYVGNALGSLNNPLIIEKAENFDKYIIDNTISISGDNRRIFGATSSAGNIITNTNVVRYVRLVNNLDFEKITTAQKHRDTYLYKTVFAGVLDGNGMSLNNLNINTDDVQLENFGLFAQIGISKEYSTLQTVVKNVNFNLRTYKSSDSSRAGVLAGTIINSNIINVKIDGGSSTDSSTIIGARNMSGALAGLILGESEVSLIDITVSNVAIEATYGSLGGEITNDSKDTSNGFYKQFNIKNVETNTEITKSFVGLYDLANQKTNLYNNDSIRTDVSYAGTIAGVIIANNSSVSIGDDKTFKEYQSKPDASSIDGVVVKDSITIRTADNSGGLFGYVGENTLIKNSYLLLSNNQIIRAFNYAGGIVAENHGIIEQCYVALSDSEQADIDNNIASANRNNNIQLFDSTDSTDYTVSIGGIAGYSANGVIIDSYSKVNVTKPYSYIAGGLVGYSEDYNYIAYSFATGSVYSKFITGGIVGLQVNRASQVTSGRVTKAQALQMYHVYALTDWNYNLGDLSVRQNITNRLYENEKSLYKLSDGSYYNFYVKMPEIGNLDIIESEALGNVYSTDHNEFYVGSAVGYTIINNSAGDSQQRFDSSKLITNANLPNYYNKDNSYYYLSNNNFVVTNTFGLMSTTGSLASGNKRDSYDNLTFSYAVDSENSINMHSYRVAYDSELNKYDYKTYKEQYIEYSDGKTYVVVDNQVTIGSTPYEVVNGSVEIEGNSYTVLTRNVANQSNVTYDVFGYSQIFNQEYLEQMIGLYSIVDGGANKSTANVFKYTYNADNRYLINNITDAFVTNENSYIWTLDKYLPKYSYGLYTSNEIISTADQLNLAFTTKSSGRVYKVQPQIDNKIQMDITSKNLSVFYNNTIKNTFLGELTNGQKPTIVFNIGTIDSSTTANTLFNILSDVSLNNIDFEINVVNSTLNSNRNYLDYGIIANVIQNSSITNCSFKLNVSDVRFDEDIQNIKFNSNNLGLMFGSIINTTIENSTFEISTGDITLNSSSIQNFGLFAGVISNTSFQNNKISINGTSNININIDKASSTTYYDGNTPKVRYGTLNVGAFGGVIGGSNITFDEISIPNINITNNYSFEALNIAKIVAYANDSNISNATISTDLNIATDPAKTIKELNIAQAVALSRSSSIKNITITGKMSVFGTSGSAKATTINVASAIGQDLRSSGVINTVSTSQITAKVNTTNANIGGLIGLSKGSTNLAINAKFSGDLSVENESNGVDNGESITYAKTYVGGILGASSGIIEMDSVLSDGKLKVTTSTTLCEVAVGGLVGNAKSNMTINDFASLAVFELMTTYENTNSNAYVSGVLGLNNAIFGGENGFTLVELPKSADVITSAITNGSVSGATRNIFYASELMGTDYESDSKFDFYALADIYESVNEYANVNLLDNAQNLSIVNAGKLKVFVPKYFENELITDADSREVFNPTELDSALSNLGSLNYYVVLQNIATTGSTTGITITANQIISGRTTQTGKVEITTTNGQGSVPTLYVFGTNNGIISNIYFKTTHSASTPQNPVGQNVALVNENNGVIVGVYAYGVTESQYSIANENNGQILKSASSTIYKFADDSKTSTYGLVNKNASSGEIYDVYSSGFVYSKSATLKDVYGIANENLGKISYAFYYIPEIMQYNNTARGIVAENVDDGSVYRCESSLVANFANTRKTIWTVENGHTQLIGVKDIEGAILVKLVMIDDGSNRVYDINDIRTSLNNANGSSNYKFDYEINFYTNEKLNYNLIRFNNGNKFANYINSLSDKYIPQGTVIILDGSADNNNKLTITTSLESFSLSTNSLLIGRYFEGSNVQLCMPDKNTLASNHELIYANEGVIAGINFVNFNFVNQNNAIRYFAPILNNTGLIYDVTFEEIVIDGGAVEYVAGIVATNNGYLINCTINNFKIVSVKYYNRICSVNNVNKGVVINCNSYSGSITTGTENDKGGV